MKIFRVETFSYEDREHETRAFVRNEIPQLAINFSRALFNEFRVDGSILREG